MKNIFLFILIIWANSISSLLYGQNPTFQNYKWDTEPKLHTLTTGELQISELELKETHIIEYAMKEDKLVSYNLVHKIIRVNDDKAIEMNNRIYLPLAEYAKMLVTKVRVINANGQVKELKDEDVKNGVNEETKVAYRYFALEGLDKGSEIESVMVVEQNAEIYGKLIYLQDNILKKDVEFKLITPSNLIFKKKLYNGLPAFTDTVLSDGRNVSYLFMDSVPGLKEEAFAVYKPHLMQLIIKLDENKNSGKKNLVNYTDVAESIYDIVHESQTSATAKNIQKLLKTINIKGKLSNDEKIRKVEDYVKTNFVVSENTNYRTLPDALEYKATDEVGITKVFAALLELLHIDYQIVLTSNRESLKFDPEFEAYNFLDTYLLYFPETKKYLCPGSLISRLNCIPFILMNNYGLFVKQVVAGKFKTGVGEIRFIDPDQYTANQSNHTIKIDFSKSIENPEIHLSLIFTGNYAQPIQPYYSYVPVENQAEMNTSILRGTLGDATFTDIEVLNKGAENLGIKPLVINAKCTAGNIIGHAGEKYLFKIGELIGPQVELYQEESRKFDIENEFNRSYNREITFDIPEGYHITNLDALKMDVSFGNKEDASCFFRSAYEVKNNRVVVKIAEDYRLLCYPKEKYQEFRKVVNASADFNKVVLVMEK